MKRVLVIGASGFLGRHVAKALLADGYQVRGTARDPARVGDLLRAGGEIVRGDISDPASMVLALHGSNARPGLPRVR